MCHSVALDVVRLLAAHQVKGLGSSDTGGGVAEARGAGGSTGAWGAWEAGGTRFASGTVFAIFTHTWDARFTCHREYTHALGAKYIDMP